MQSCNICNPKRVGGSGCPTGGGGDPGSRPDRPSSRATGRPFARTRSPARTVAPAPGCAARTQQLNGRRKRRGGQPHWNLASVLSCVGAASLWNRVEPVPETATEVSTSLAAAARIRTARSHYPAPIRFTASSTAFLTSPFVVFDFHSSRTGLSAASAGSPKRSTVGIATSPMGSANRARTAASA